MIDIYVQISVCTRLRQRSWFISLLWEWMCMAHLIGSCWCIQQMHPGDFTRRLRKNQPTPNFLAYFSIFSNLACCFAGRLIFIIHHLGSNGRWETRIDYFIYLACSTHIWSTYTTLFMAKLMVYFFP